jgi:uncharacterized Zn-binding protein involved in type VI secretion
MAVGPFLLLGDSKMMPMARVLMDSHLGHASPTGNPFHKTPYVATPQGKVFVNGSLAVTIGGATACGDSAVTGSSKVFAVGIPVHRVLDATSGHGSWLPNICASGSFTCLAGG